MYKYYQVVSAFASRASSFIQGVSKGRNPKAVLAMMSVASLTVLAGVFAKLIHGSTDPTSDVLPVMPANVDRASELENLSSSKYASRLSASAQDYAVMSPSIENSKRLMKLNDTFNSLAVLLAKEGDQEAIAVASTGIKKLLIALHFGVLDTEFDISQFTTASVSDSRESVADIEGALCAMIKLSGSGLNLISPR